MKVIIKIELIVIIKHFFIILFNYYIINNFTLKV